MHRLLRRDLLCSGGPLVCESATDVRCADCGATWTPVDIRIPGSCLSCNSTSYVRFHQDCEVTRLDTALDSDAGLRVHQAGDLLSALETGYTVTLDDVTAEQFRDVQTFRAERDKWQAEEMKRREQQRGR